VDEEDTFSCDLKDILALFNESDRPEKPSKKSGSGKGDPAIATGEDDTSTRSNPIPPTGNLSRRETALKTAAQIGKVLGVSSVDLDKVLKFALERIRTILNVEAGHVYLREKDQMTTAMAFDTKNRSMKKVQFKVGQGAAGRAVALGKTILVNDAEKSSRLYREIDRQENFTIRSALCIPLLSQKKIIGVLEVLNKIESNFDAEDKKLLQPISDAISSALQHYHWPNNSLTPTTSA
jgi:transcriptional regulator with GAF, ATPase, and Fis domain